MQKRTLDPEGKRSQVLTSAQELFIANGYNGVSMSNIAKHSGVTQSMIHHYFGSKQGLWEAVKEQCFATYLANQQSLLDDDDDDVASFIHESISSRFRFFQDNPQMARFLSWLQILGDPMGMETGQEVGPKIIARIQDLQAKNEIRGDITPENILAISLALTTYWFQSQPVIQYLSERATENQQTADLRS